MAEFTGYKETSNRHLRFKLQSLGRRLDELEEATKNLQKAEDELLDLQDKVIQAEGSNSSMLADVEALRKRVLKIEGKDEEIKKAEELCQLMKEKLEEEESLTRELKSEIEQLQKRMAELEKLEEAFGRSKNDCTQLCLSLNEEKNLTKKISTELEILRMKVKELELSEDRLDKTEHSLASELEKLKSLTLSFANERKYFNEREKQSEKLIQELTQKLELNNKLNRTDQARNASNLLERSSNNLLDRNDLRIEDDLTSALPCKEDGKKGSLDYLKHVENETRNKSENQKNKNQEDNKVKDLNQEIEKLKTQIKHFEFLEEELKKMKAKNNDLQDSYLSEQNKNKLLAGQLEEIKTQIKKQKDMENGEVEGEEMSFPSRVRHDRHKYRGVTADSPILKHKTRELSPQYRRERTRNREFSSNNDHYTTGSKQVPSPSLITRRATKTSNTSALLDTVVTDIKRMEEKSAVAPYLSMQKDSGTPQNEVKKSREQPSVLSRYPPAAHEHKSWKASSKPGTESGRKTKIEKPSQTFSDACQGNSALDEKSIKGETTASLTERMKTRQAEMSELCVEIPFMKSNHAPSNETASSGSYHTSSQMLAAESTSCKAETATVSVLSHRQSPEGKSKRAINFQGREFTDTFHENTKPTTLSKYSNCSESQDDILQILTSQDNEEMDQSAPSVMGQTSVGIRSDSLISKAIKPASHDKLNTDEELGKNINATAESELEIRKKPCSREFSGSRGVLRAAVFENDKNTRNEDGPSKSINTSSDVTSVGLKSKRSFSPREALRSKAIIKPAIIEKDMKEVMGGAGSEEYFQKQKPVFKTVTNKMTSSITIFPSDPATTRANTNEAAKERRTSTSNIRVIPNELSSVTNSVSTPFEISINKNDIALKLSEADKIGDLALRNRAETLISRSSITIKPSEPTEKNNCGPSLETISWKSHGFLEADPPEAKHITLRSSWRTRRGLQCLEDSQIKVEKNTASTRPNGCKSSTDLSEIEGSNARICLLEQNSRRPRATINSWRYTPDLEFRRTQSSLSASELSGRRSYIHDPITASTWNRMLPEEGKDFVPSSRRKQYGSSEQLSLSETSWKSPTLQMEWQQGPGTTPPAQLDNKTEDQGISHASQMTSRR
ncbi:leucine zipper protein 1 isoform X2 [Carettochelys insculpta]|uniref:leucine zipper protein 1 isoform X2 n=1 Tax=Carettochelys insculpta TaxID=44489 RepID=UPI003EB82272